MQLHARIFPLIARTWPIQECKGIMPYRHMQTGPWFSRAISKNLTYSGMERHNPTKAKCTHDRDFPELTRHKRSMLPSPPYIFGNCSVVYISNGALSNSCPDTAPAFLIDISSVCACLVPFYWNSVLNLSLCLPLWLVCENGLLELWLCHGQTCIRAHYLCNHFVRFALFPLLVKHRKEENMYCLDSFTGDTVYSIYHSFAKVLWCPRPSSYSSN